MQQSQRMPRQSHLLRKPLHRLRTQKLALKRSAALKVDSDISAHVLSTT